MKTLVETINQDLSLYKKDTNILIKIMYGLIFLFIYKNFRAIFLYRIAHYTLVTDSKLSHKFIEFLRIYLSSIEIEKRTIIGPTIHFPHPHCIVIGGGNIGSDVWIYQGTTIGMKRDVEEFANIGNNVNILAGSTILGNVDIGNNATIGAGAVVLHDLLDDVVVGGLLQNLLRINNINSFIH